MRGYKKGFFIVISVLLCSVMITTTALSGTLAKYTTSDSSSDSARVAKWGVTAEIALSDEIKNSGATIVTNNENGKISHTITNLKMAPGYDYSDAFQISISGKSEVRLKVRFDIAVDYDLENFKLPVELSNAIESDYYVPIGYNLGCLNKDGVYETYLADNPTSLPDSQTGFLLRSAFASYCDLTLATENLDSFLDLDSIYLEKIFEPGENIVFHPVEVTIGEVDTKELFDSVNVNDFDFGWYWPFSHQNHSTYDKIDTWLVDNGTPKIDNISINIIIEQISGDYETPVSPWHVSVSE